MLSAISRAFTEAFRNLRNNFFQTFLSVLGIIIGVGALVAMLSMIDGLEAYASEMIADKSSLENLMIVPNKGTQIDGIYTERDTIAILSPEVMEEFLDSLPYAATAQLMYSSTDIGFTADSNKIGLRYSAITLPMLESIPDSLFTGGEMFTAAASTSGARTAVVNETLAKRLLAEGDTQPQNAVGKYFHLLGDSLTVIGVYNDQDSINLSLIFPLATMPLMAEAPTPVATMNIALGDVNNVLAAEKFADGWIARHFSEIDEPADTYTQSGYLEQLAQGVMVFKLVMGFLIGIAVVVGGVGVMNVLLMSISERTPEIGVRMAVGANRRNIIVQFLSESIAISFIGSILGILLGMGVALIAAPIMNLIVDDLEFRAVFTVGTLVTVAVVALLTGVLFGTYPARKAAGLDPVVAIRR